MPKVVTRQSKKEAYDAKLCNLLETFDKAFLVHADHVGSKQFQGIRAVRLSSIGDHEPLGYVSSSQRTFAIVEFNTLSNLPPSACKSAWSEPTGDYVLYR